MVVSAKTRFSKIVVGAAAVLTASGCATVPVDHPVDRTQTYTEGKEVIWERTVAFFAQRNLSIKTIEKASGIIAADRQISFPSAGIEGFADCGKDPLMRSTAQSIDLNVFMRPLGEQRTLVTVNIRFTETRILGYNMLTVKTITCVSTGKLEANVLEALGHGL